jgi:hypothetical protein
MVGAPLGGASQKSPKGGCSNDTPHIEVGMRKIRHYRIGLFPDSLVFVFRLVSTLLLLTRVLHIDPDCVLLLKTSSYDQLCFVVNCNAVRGILTTSVTVVFSC